MYIREAVSGDSDELQALQERCPQGSSLIVSTVNTPDFFARAKAYESYKVYVACEDNRILGSGACAIREAIVNGNLRRVGYEFQYFTSPDHRRRNIARQLRQHVEKHLTQRGAQLSYALIMEGNLASMRLFEREGFKRYRTLLMSVLAVQREMNVPSHGEIRAVEPGELANVADLLNRTWQGRELYELNTAETLAQFIHRTPAFSHDNLQVLEDKGEIVACLGGWNWGQVMRVTVKSLSRKLKMIGWLLTTTRISRQFPKPGDTLKQMMLTLVGFNEPAHLAVLIRHLNNQGLQKGVQQLFFVCERGDALLRSMKGFIRVNNKFHLYTKQLSQHSLLAAGPVFVNGIDL